jgi:hypothetical protein
MLWYCGTDRIPPFHQASYCCRDTAPVLPSSSSCWVIAEPTRLTPRVTSGGMFGLVGSLNGGTKIRAGNAAVWWVLWISCGNHWW